MSSMLKKLSSSLKLFGSKFSKFRHCNVLIVGLDNGGKTTIIRWLQDCSGGEITEVAPTVGFQVEEFNRNKIKFKAFDMSGQGKYRNMWNSQYADVDAIIFVIDSSDSMRFCVARDELEIMLDNTSIASSMIPVLFLANKVDKPNSVPLETIAKEMGLDNVDNRAWTILPTCAKTGQGIDEAFNWLSDNIGVF